VSNQKIRSDTTKKSPPGSTSSTMSMASFQKGTMVFNPVRLKSSSMKSSVTSQKYSCPGREQNQLIHVRVEVGVDDADKEARKHQRGIPDNSRRRVVPWKKERTVSLLFFHLFHYIVSFTSSTDSFFLVEIYLARIHRHGLHWSRHEVKLKLRGLFLPRSFGIFVRTPSPAGFWLSHCIVSSFPVQSNALVEGYSLRWLSDDQLIDFGMANSEGS
jgi:hypothetical protein